MYVGYKESGSNGCHICDMVLFLLLSFVKVASFELAELQWNQCGPFNWQFSNLRPLRMFDY